MNLNDSGKLNNKTNCLDNTNEQGPDHLEPQDEIQISIKIKTLDDKITELNLSQNATILSLKNAIRDEMNVPLDRQRLLFKGKMLEDS